LRDEGHTTMPMRDHIQAVPVPGCVDGWVTLHQRFGRLSLAEVLEPARSYAADGFPASPTLAASVPNVIHLEAAADYAGVAAAGDIVRRPGVARTLAAVAAGGRDAFYQGELGAGEYSAGDLARSQAGWVEPLTLDAFGHGLWTVPPNSQGYLTLASAGIADGLALPDEPDDPLWAHLLIEASRQAGYDRVEVLHEGADGRALIGAERLARRRAAIDAGRAANLGDSYRDGGTIYLCAVDAERMGVSLIQSNASGWGAHLVEPSTRIFLQDRGIGFSLEPGHPAEYGPGRRPPHTLSPALVTGPDGGLHAVIGSMGGDSQPQILLQLLARLLHAGHSPGSAVAAARWSLGLGFTTWDERGEVAVLLEGHAPPGWDTGLADRGHRVRRLEPFSNAFGHAHLIVNHGDHLAGASDPRPRGGAASGY
jgi:gamma-glutamyltranspeptidase/glutathione hydrolase